MVVEGQAVESPTPLAAQFSSILLDRIANNKLILPTIPAAATMCLQQLRDPNFEIKQIAGTLARDPVLAAQVLRLANSAAFGKGGITSLVQSASRIGSAKLKSLLIEVSAKKAFQSRDPGIAKMAEGIWQHSVAVAILARDISTLSGSTDGESAYLSGLLHDVGKPILAVILLEAESMLSQAGTRWIGSAAWMEIMQSTHRKVGVALAEKWNLPEVVSASIRDCDEYERGDRTSISNFVRFANALAKREGLYVGEVNVEDNDAMIMIGRSVLGTKDEEIGRLTEGLKDRVRSSVE